MSYRDASRTYNIPKSVLQRRHKNPDGKRIGGQPILGTKFVEVLVKRIITCGKWGFPLGAYDLRLIVKGCLDRRGMKTNKFKDNLPGCDWVQSFLKRHKNNIAQRMCQNIKRNRASVSQAVINEYFDNLQKSIENIPPSNIINYDETNLSDDPGRKKSNTASRHKISRESNEPL